MNNFFFILTYWLGGGTERVFENVASALYNKSSENRIFLYVINNFDSSNYSLPRYIKILKTKHELKKVFMSSDSKILVNFSGDWKSGLLSWFLSKRYISWVHCNPYTMKNARTAILNFYLLKKSMLIVCVCHEQKEILETDFGFKTDIQVIYNSVDNEKITNLSEVPLENVNYSYILMVARIDFNSKDFFTVIDAYELLPAEMKNKYKLVFLGEGPDKNKVYDYIRKKQLINSIFLVGFDKNPYRWYRNAVCNILSSRTEGFAVSCIEAMSLGCPQIITDYKTGSNEIACGGKTAVIVKIGNAEEMSGAIKKIVSESSFRNNLKDSAANFVKQFYQDRFEENVSSFFASAEHYL